MYAVVYGLLYVLSLLPLKVLFLLSDLAYGLLYYVIGYRKKVVFQNLAIAFPNKPEAERKRIAKKFYRNFTDNFIETIKLLSADEAFINRHFKADYSAFEAVYKQGKKCQIHTGHNFNWELANLAIAANIPQKLLTVYMPIESGVFEKLFLKLRIKTGAALLPATKIRSSILPWRNTQYALGLVSDQSPADPRAGYWIPFFGRPTVFLKAPENGARVANLPVIFCFFVKKKRGYYEGFFEIGEDDPAALPKGELTKRYAAYIETFITQYPEMYLWSHRRWKWDWKDEYGPVIQ
ncbi:lysophospholipid acyltransferase family protein [Flavisolibacter sp. BT320]|nr:lysophospholipid acyltransferase family protein [Flavisolibacter longurius]